jgi:excinuclease ABC subunit B
MGGVRDGAEEAIRARNPNVDPRAKAGAFGERIAGPHKPTLDEMGPHASLPLKSGKALPQKPGLAGPRPTRTIEFEESGEKTKRRGRPKKTGRPGQ